ncbi:hypothetical protein XcvCFBP7112P_11615 [Xanthomonas citri pv. vignicola]|nr:hypothetical protein XcvCFBP7112P_11615 [Xanthomonas citri pv. vignicola]MBZ3934011.1 hypothetical protein [Xanthomonas campestris pv. merremiae]
MQNATRLRFNQFAEQIAKLNGITSAFHSLAVDPTVQQKLETRMQDLRSGFISDSGRRGIALPALMALMALTEHRSVA